MKSVGKEHMRCPPITAAHSNIKERKRNKNMKKKLKQILRNALNVKILNKQQHSNIHLLEQNPNDVTTTA